LQGVAHLLVAETGKHHDLHGRQVRPDEGGYSAVPRRASLDQLRLQLGDVAGVLVEGADEAFLLGEAISEPLLGGLSGIRGCEGHRAEGSRRVG